MLGRCPLVLILFAASMISFQSAPVLGQESSVEAIGQAGPTVQVVTQSNITSMETPAGPGLLSRFPIHLSLSMGVGYDDNSQTTGTQQGSLFTNGSVVLSYDLRKERTQISLSSGAGVAYRTGAGTNDVNAHLNLSLSHNISLRLKLDATIYAAYRTEPDFSSDVGLNTRSGNYVSMDDSFSATYHWLLHFSTVSSYRFRLVQYEGSSLGSLQNRVENTFGEELRFNLWPLTTVLGEYRFEVIDYDSAPRDSTTHFLLAGVDQSFSPQLKFVARGGATFRSYKNDGDRIDPHFEGSLTYAGAHHLSLGWNTSYGIEEPNATDVSSRTTFRTGLALKYSLSARLSSTVSAYYHHDENQGGNLSGNVGTGFSADAFDISLGVRYAIYRHFNIDLGFERTQVNSGEAARSYSRNRYSVGLNFTY